ncbi:acyltransferase family protein [Kineosporia sp. NBRC 101731]|uniref:acyltransferase family protein n=1 Tax=Kineosporia sp. NBRC 101731 TaxID=3032199 RepID=UPI0025549A79|nr:acyltransferase family protein [Kineosporia sp. NBRC 101731]
MSNVEIEAVPARGLRITTTDDVRPAPRPGFRTDIEGLRALAVLLVVLYHCGIKTFTGGYVGVDVFFVISGFLITSHLAREVADTGRLRIGRFYALRALRLLPAASLVLVCTLAAAWIWLPPLRLRAIAWDAVASAGYVLNVRLIQVGNDYRSAGASPSPLQHFWSLAVEEQFYLAIPLLALVCLVLLRRRAAFAALLTTLIALSFADSLVTSQTDSVAAYFGAPTRVWELGAGALLALVIPQLLRDQAKTPPSSGTVGGEGLPDHEQGTRGAPRGHTVTAAPGRVTDTAGRAADVPGQVADVSGRAARALGRGAVALRWGGLSAIAYAAVTFDSSTPFPGWSAAIPVLGTVAVIIAGRAGPGRVLSLPLLQFVGARSYSIYLWHWPALIIAPYLLEREISTYEKLLVALVALGLACAGYTLVEQPLRHHEQLRARPWQAGVLAAALTAVTVALAVLAPALPARQTQGEGLAAGLNLQGPPSQRHQQLARRLDTATRVTVLPRNLEPSLQKASGDEPAISGNGCFVAVAATRTPKRCESLGSARPRKTVVLFGDSHAAQWYPALNALARENRWRLAVFTKVMCTPAQVHVYAETFRGDYRTCNTWRANSIARIHALKPDLVVTTSIADHLDLVGSASDVDATWATGWARTVSTLLAGGTDVAFLADSPRAKTDVPECLSQNPRNIQACAQASDRATGTPQRTAIARAVRSASARVVDPAPWFCTATSCPVVVGNTLVYRDDNHITGAYARALASLLFEELHIR